MDTTNFNADQVDFNIPLQEFTLDHVLTELGNRQSLHGLTGVPSGFSDLDVLLSGWQQSELIILASRPSMGKSSLILSALRNAAVDFGVPVALFSLEMGAIQVAHRLIAAEVEINLDKFRKASLETHEWVQLSSLKIQRLKEAPIFIDYTYNLKFDELRAKCLQMIKRHGIKVVAIDNIHLMLSTNSEESISEYEELSKLIRSLKSLSSELKIPIIALSQVNRAVETRLGDKRPQLHDLRGSGAIEEHADTVMMLYRPECYSIIHDENGNLTAGKAELIIAKNRSGSPETIQLRFINKFAKFCDFDSYFTPEVNGLRSIGNPQPSAGNVFKSKAKIMSNFGNADPSQETPF